MNTFIFLFTLLFSVSAFSQSSDSLDTRPIAKISQDLEDVEQVDPASGSLVVRHVDLRLPGNGGLDIVVQRMYTSQSTSAGLSATHLESFNWTALGPGWRMHVAPRIYHENIYSVNGAATGYSYGGLDRLCQNVQASNFPPHPIMLELPNGDVEALYSGGGYVGLSKSNWKVSCHSGRVTVQSPAGVSYDFGNFNDRKIGRYIGPMMPLIVIPGPPADSPTITYLDAVKATDANGNWLQFDYQQFGAAIAPWPVPSTGSRVYPNYSAAGNESPSSLLKQVTASDGRIVTFDYDTTSGRLMSMTDNTGRFWQYQYLSPDAANSRVLSKVIRPDETAWEYGYGAGEFFRVLGDNTIPLSDANISARKLTSLKYPSGGTVSYTYGFYNLSGRITSGGSWIARYSRGERIATRSLSSGETWTYSYYRGGAGEYDVTTISGPNGVETFQHMGLGFAMTTVAGYPPAQYQNNAWRVGKLMGKTNVDGSTEAYVWQARELFDSYTRILELGFVHDQKVWAADLISKTVVRDGATYTTTYSDYDAYGNPGTIVESGPNGGERTKTLTYLNDPDQWIIGKLKDESFPGSSTTRNFDERGNLLDVTHDGVTTRFTYDSEGNVASKTTPRGLLTSYSEYKRGIAQREVQPEEITIARIVDDAGNVMSETNGEGKTTRYTYDGLNRVRSEQPPIGNQRSIVYTDTSKTVTRGDLIEATHYDGFGRPASISLGGVITTYKYDAFDRKIFESNPGANIGTQYEYDGLHRLIRIINTDETVQAHRYGAATKTVINERGKETTYTYRSYGDPSEQYVMHIAAADPDASITFTRNARDMVTTAQQAGLMRSYEYDDRYYLTSVTHPETGVTTYGRDDAGNMTSRTVGTSASTTYTYDGQNRLIKVDYPGNTPSLTNRYNKVHKLLSATASTGNRSFGYDANGNLLSESLELNGITLAMGYGYNGNDQMAFSGASYPRSEYIVNYAPDVLGRPTRVSGYVSKVEYWPSGQIKQIDYVNGTVTQYEQNARLWPSTFNTRNSAELFLDSSYTYDGNGNLTDISDSADGSYDRAMAYDDLDRLTDIAGPWGAGVLRYDGLGNLTRQDHGTANLSYSYDASNRLKNVSGERTAAYTYDAHGNIASASGNTYSYDEVPNLRCVNCADVANKIEYTYDATNHRSSIKKAGTATYELYGAQGNLLLEFTPGKPDKLIEYIYLGGKRIAQRVTP